MKHLLFIGFTLACILEASCASMNVSPECQSQIDACLRRCQQGTPPNPSQRSDETQCEEDCYDQCY